ncbi:TetR/AcrR family transcriptional regulator [Rhizobium lusitanum]|uniref:AcrR family transcriptional regulator n=1 Tax=Rhizobium lusitanum TaxID=293958 RepID=A0A7X0IST9_9HYPH|nr:TetR/AcrR family transcriptional regulator [Rhizobium lusitanum]MBB6486088.1 AcrR family transcriptional regulator [Rhizobium lusitanum]
MAPSGSIRSKGRGGEAAVRERILEAAFTAFTQNGYAATSTLEIATQARASKRELYSLVGNKQEMLVACIRSRAGRLQLPADLPTPRDRETFAEVLSSFGARLVHEISDPTVIAIFRLAIAEAARAPEVALTLDTIGREAARSALRRIMLLATQDDLLDGTPAERAEQFLGLLWGDLLIGLLLGVAERPQPMEIAARARNAASTFIQLYAGRTRPPAITPDP